MSQLLSSALSYLLNFEFQQIFKTNSGQIYLRVFLTSVNTDSLYYKNAVVQYLVFENIYLLFCHRLRNGT